MTDLVRVSGLSVVAQDDSGAVATLVRDVSFSIPRGEVLALIGESGSGKTTIALALMGYARSGCRIAGGSILVDGLDLATLDEAQRRTLRGRKISYVAQSAAAAFDPSKTIMEQVIEPALVHRLMRPAQARAKAVELFTALGLPNPGDIGRRFPHQVSGGQLQRLMAAMALITDPALVILDEPTTALDVTTQIEVLRVFKQVVRERGATAVYVSHDLAVVAQMADRIVVLNHGEVREAGATDQVLHAPADPYTKALMAAARPTLRIDALADAPAEARPPLLEVRGLSAGYGRRDAQGLSKSLVLHDIDLRIERGATVGVIGESGSGKSTLARAIAGLLVPARGTILFNGRPLPAGLPGRTSDQFRRIQIVFQNADTALNPGHSVARILGRPLELYHRLSGPARDRRIAELLDLTRLPASVASRRVGELSGGQKQRINLARALAAEPDLILCDEVTSALDTVVGAAILDLLAELRRELSVSFMFISHDISTVRSICDEVVVLYAGRKVETGDRQAFAGPPVHPYTHLLISSVPEMRRGWLEETAVAQAAPPLGDLARDAELCSFLSRCPVRIDGVCNLAPPPRIRLGAGHEDLCHHSDEALRRLQAPRRAAG